MQYILEASGGQKRAVFTTKEDDVIIVLQDNNGKLPYVETSFNELLTYSGGKQWKFRHNPYNSIEMENIANKVIITGTVGELRISAGISFDRRDLLEISLKWINISPKTIKDSMVGITLHFTPHFKEKIVMPHMIYNNNPSADRERIVPHINRKPGSGFICEEHRLPIPCINIEWNECEEYKFFTLFAIPSKLESDCNDDHYWSIGGTYDENGLILAGLSGVLLFDDKKDYIYGYKCKIMPYEGGYFDFYPDMTVRKRYLLDWGTAGLEGRGFRNIISRGLQIFEPRSKPVLSLEEMMHLKIKAMDRRWYDDGTVRGYLATLPGNVLNRPPYILYGWSGQCLRMAWCSAKLGFGGNDEDRISRCAEAVDFYLSNSSTGFKELRYGYYFIEDKKWYGARMDDNKVISGRMTGDNMNDLGEIILLFGKHGRRVPDSWLKGLCDMAGFLLEKDSMLNGGIYPASWHISGIPADDFASVAGIPCVRALVKAFMCTGSDLYLKHAEKVMSRYYEMSAKTFEYPFARSTLDARCEDKEAGIYFFLAAYELFKLTGKNNYREWAEVSVDWVLTFVYFWDTGFKKGSVCDRMDFAVTGWPGVSVQNHHLDVLFPCFELWDFGRLSGNSRYQELGLTILSAFSHGISKKPGEWDFPADGEQAEQFFQTNFFEGKWRGGFHRWDPSWIIAQTLESCLKFKDALS